MCFIAAPTPTARGTPSGIKLRDGFSSKVTLGRVPTISLWEKSVKPPSIDGGEPIPQTTMHNVTWETMAAQALKKLDSSSFKFAYDPGVWTDIVSAVNQHDTITKTYGDGSTLAFFGYVQKVEFDELVKGQQPEGTITIVPTNADSTGAEQAPVITSVAGT